MSALYEEVKNFFIEDDWVFYETEKTDDVSIIQLICKGRNGRWTCYGQIDEKQRLFLFYSVFPNSIQKKCIPAVADFICRANYGLKIGNFEIDTDTGEIRYKTSADFENASIDRGIISNLVYANLWTMDRYMQGILDVAVGYEDVSSTIEQIENDPEGTSKLS